VQYAATVVAREQLSEHLVRLRLGGLDGFTGTGVLDEWVGLVVPGQFQSRYYTVREHTSDEVTIDVVIHDVGLVTELARRDCVGEQVTITEPRGAFAPPDDSTWVHLVGDLTAAPAIARIAAGTDLRTRIWLETEDDLGDYLPADADVTWVRPPAPGASALSEVVEGLEWPTGPGYFWMGGESAQMRAVRKHLMREVRLPGGRGVGRRWQSERYHVMGYWRGVTARQPRAVDPGPIWRAGKAAGRSEPEIWADYDRATES
jgi:NADPH-dependent ferric siderophore reductase